MSKFPRWFRPLDEVCAELRAEAWREGRLSMLSECSALEHKLTQERKHNINLVSENYILQYQLLSITHPNAEYS